LGFGGASRRAVTGAAETNPESTSSANAATKLRASHALHVVLVPAPTLVSRALEI